jgi:exonuclease 3'-5' domain-containing protein 1
MDHSALFHGHATSMTNVLDLQLVDIFSRALRGEVRGEGTTEQLTRLSLCVSTTEIVSHRESYLKLHKLASLSNAMTEHKVLGARTGGTGTTPYFIY